jgi:GntR family carbon starvation induced transcriptional regulator
MVGIKKTFTEIAYDSIRNDVISGKLPPGSKLKIEALSKLYNLGASPVREALSRLASEGFVVSEDRRGFSVVPVSLSDLKEITDARLLIEISALEKSIKNKNEAWESEVVASFYQLSKVEGVSPINDYDLWEQKNRDFHFALLSACGSKWLLRFFHIIYDQHRRYRNIAITFQQPTNRNLHQEHKNIYEAALAGDAKTACQETEKHILETAKVDNEIFANL